PLLRTFRTISLHLDVPNGAVRISPRGIIAVGVFRADAAHRDEQKRKEEKTKGERHEEKWHGLRRFCLSSASASPPRDGDWRCTWIERVDLNALFRTRFNIVLGS